MKKYDVTVPQKPYTDKKTGQEKKSYRNVGRIIQGVAQATGKPYIILELHMFPFLEFAIFEQKPQEGQSEKTVDFGADGGYAEVPAKRSYTKKEDDLGTIDYGESINPEDIPF